jgi:hypothetical protein
VQRSGRVHEGGLVPSKIIAGVLIIGALIAARAAGAADEGVAQFFGNYVGRTITAPDGSLSPRDLSIEIKPHGDNGFLLAWTTVIRDASGTRHRAYSIAFTPSTRTGIFASAMRRDAFGHSEPLDPLKGEPYVWADIEGPTLRVHALLITDDGGYEMQVYRRTLTADGMTLEFSRNRNGKELKTVYGNLQRKAE